MRNDNFTSLADVIKKAMNNHPQRNKLFESAVICAWKQIIPLEVQEKIKKVSVKEDKLVVVVESSALRHTLQMNKVRLLEELNATSFEKNIIDIVFL